MQRIAVAAIVATAEIATAQALDADMKKIIPLGGVLDAHREAAPGGRR